MNEVLNSNAEPVAAGQTNVAIEKLERQVERGSLFTHTAIGETTLRLNEVESFTYALMDVLVEKGMISSEEMKGAVENIRLEMIERGEVADTGVALRVDPPTEVRRPPVKVDCEARWHICHGVCCMLDFALSQEEVESGKIKWDLGRPYYIRHEANGLCAHNDKGTGKCRIYEDRPAICRSYSCAEDRRIWKDFEKMDLNEEWLQENFNTSRPRALRVLMKTPCS